MNRIIYCLFFIMMVLGGCSPYGFLPYKNRTLIRNEFTKRYYLDSNEKVEFAKGYKFRFLSKKYLREAKRSHLYRQLVNRKDYLRPVYAATRKSNENKTQFIFVFKVLNNFEIEKYLTQNFRFIKEFLFDWAYNFNSDKNRFAECYYRHDNQSHIITTASLVTLVKSQTSYLLLYTSEYLNPNRYLEILFHWEKDRLAQNIIDSIHTYSYAIKHYGLDTVLQLKGFVELGPIINSIDSIDFFSQSGSFSFNDDCLLFFKKLICYYHQGRALFGQYSGDSIMEASTAGVIPYFQVNSTFLNFIEKNKKTQAVEHVLRKIRKDFKYYKN